MYWNKDLFSSAGISRPPQYWDDFSENVEIFTDKNEVGNIVQAGNGFGELNNIKNGKDILSMLIIQSGNPIMKTDGEAILKAALRKGAIRQQKQPAVSSVKFFNDFSNPIKPFILGIKPCPRLTRCLPKARWLCISAMPAKCRK